MSAPDIVHRTWLMPAVLLFVACELVAGIDDRAVGTPGNVGGDAGSGGGEGGHGGDACAPLAECGGTCVDPTNDPDHCGACDAPCGAGEPYCVESVCSSVCPIAYVSET